MSQKSIRIKVWAISRVLVDKKTHLKGLMKNSRSIGYGKIIPIYKLNK